MTALLAPVLLLLAVLAALVAIGFFWLSLRAAFGAADPAAVLRGSISIEQQALEDERDALLRLLRDLKFEWQIGKLSEDDYREQESLLRKRARQVMRLLDAAADPFRDEAERLVSAAGASPPERIPASPAESVAPQETENARQICPKCGLKNDEDALFCKGCGSSLAQTPAQEPNADSGDDAA